MERILSWIVKHKLLTVLLVITIFFAPLLNAAQLQFNFTICPSWSMTISVLLGA